MSAIDELIGSEAYKKIENDIELFVKEMLENYTPVAADQKTIHDPVWGSVEYSAWEMQLIDSPLFQRLRDINQVGLAMLTYPSARHSRFEHSIGVVSAAKKMCEKINVNSNSFVIKDEDKNAIYLAGLLHDIGHCFYSHLSETVYGQMSDFVKLRNEFNRKLSRKPKAHEMLSFIIINTKTFKEFFEKNIDYPNIKAKKIYLFSDVGQMIIGSNIERDNRIMSFQTAIINGAFDADKLDYIRRDSLTAGLSLQYDIERLFTKILVHSVTVGDKIEDRLVIRFNGVTAIEELTFCKIMLFSYIYYHQKVLISEIMIKDYVYGLCQLNIIKNYADFLRFTDSQILELGKEQGEAIPFPEWGTLELQTLATNIKVRNLPKRCFEVSQSNIEASEFDIKGTTMKNHCENLLKKCRENSSFTLEEFEKEVAAISTLIMKNEAPLGDALFAELRELTFEEMLKVRKEFYEKLVTCYIRDKRPVTFSLFDIYLIFPKLVDYGSATEEVILGKDNEKLMTINDFIKLDHWASSFNSNKWRGYVFVTDKIDKKIAFEVAENLVLKGQAKLKNPAAYLRGI